MYWSNLFVLIFVLKLHHPLSESPDEDNLITEKLNTKTEQLLEIKEECMEIKDETV